MALQKQPVAINFTQGLETKSDPYQLPIGKFLSLVNSIFTKQGRLTKRNGFDNITRLPDQDQVNLMTLNDNLIATGTSLLSYSSDLDEWIDKGTVNPVALDVQSLVRNSTSQSSPDVAIASSGLACLVYEDSSGGNYYQVSDSTTGSQVVARTALPDDSFHPRVFLLGNYFIITFKVEVAAAPHLQYIAVPVRNPSDATDPTDISTSMTDVETSGYDGYVVQDADKLFLAWEGASNTVKIAYLTDDLTVSAATTLATSDCNLMTVTNDAVESRIYISFWDSSSEDAFTAAFDYSLNQTMAKTQILTSIDMREITSVAVDGVATIFYEVNNVYGFTDGAVSDYISKVTCTRPGSGTGAGTAGTPAVMLRSVGLASKSFIDAMGTFYMLVAYGDMNQTPATDNSNQPTYFLVDSDGNISMRLAYSNGGGYAATQVLPNVTFLDGSYYIPYLITDFLTTVNKGTDLPSGTPTNAIYTQKGVNLAIFDISDAPQYSSEIAGAIHLTGGQLWEYDGVKPVEHGFHVWPENITGTTSASGGDIDDGTYNYVFTYEWTDNAGNLHRSAPSIPVTVTTTGGDTSTNTLNVPTLRLTYKVSPNPVRIVGYRWSENQQVYYQFTSVTDPIENDTSVDYIAIEDELSDAAILGNTLLYTTGGVLENIAAPASSASALFKNRLFLIDAEDKNLLVYSKQVIQNVPVEMSDFLTLYIAPTTGAQGSTGPMRAISAMDDKLIIFKQDAIYYVTGIGPDNTGANNDFSDPIFITSTVGCSNPNSIVLIPAGLMFQSDKGIWILGRDLSTNYIGAPVEAFNDLVVKSATAVPGTNQVRFVMENNVTLMYDYFFQQWSEHTNISAIDATLYQGKYTYLNSYGRIYQEQQGRYTDGSVPVLMEVETGWINASGLQGYERFYFANLLGTYYSPFTMQMGLAYDYNPNDEQSVSVTPDNFSEPWGGEALWGSGGPWGGPGNVFSARVFPEKQKCESFKVRLTEVFDATMGQDPGQGLSLSGLALAVGIKKGFRTQSARKSFG